MECMERGGACFGMHGKGWCLLACLALVRLLWREWNAKCRLVLALEVCCQARCQLPSGI